MLIQITILVLASSIINLLLIDKEDHLKLKRRALEWSLIAFALSIVIWIVYTVKLGFQTNQLLSLTLSWTSVAFAIDGISLYFIVLTSFLTPLCVLVSWNSIRYLVREFMICLLVIHLLLIGVFTALDIVVFYICFEAVLIPMFLIIGVWGARQEKIRAAYYFFFFTLLGSVFMLLAIFKIYSLTGTTDYQALLNIRLPASTQIWLFLGFFLSFAVKIPKIPFHIWLPQAHVEAPVAGSVILAGILLKLGGYGFLRFAWPLLPVGAQFFAPVIITLSLVAVIFGSLTTCRQVDMKRLIAYSSVAHMGLVTLGIFTHTVEGSVAAVFMMIAHGLVSSALFIAVTIPYDRFGTRLIRYYRGLVQVMPIYTVFFMILTLANIAIPLSCNFIGEFLSLLSAFQFSLYTGIAATSGVILSAIYALYLFNRVCFGSISPLIFNGRDLSRRETYIQVTLAALILLTGIIPSIILEPTYLSLTLNVPNF